MSRFSGKSVIVTGGSSGIGRAVADLFATGGARVLAIGRNRERLAELEREGLETAVVDVRDTAGLHAAFDRHVTAHGGPNVLVNCAGVVFGEAILEITAASWEETIATNLNAVFYGSQWAAQKMVAGSGGAIVNVASVDAFAAESPGAHYCTSKAAVVMLTQCFAYEFGHLGVRTNAVAPGFTATPMTMGDGSADSRRFFDDYIQRIPLRRAGLPMEQARVVAFLASEDASFINGETIVVDGGQLKGFWSHPRSIPGAAYDDYITAAGITVAGGADA
jgi:NAD(P)-dependent dehydrogenase (short-subunit alcohol dehydrogenase family)